MPENATLLGVVMGCAEIIDKLPNEHRKLAIQVLSEGYDAEGNSLAKMRADKLIAEHPRCDCGELGIPRIHNTLPCGTHCDECWDKLLADYNGRCW